MKVYIPFNSQNFNSIFTTLSISPPMFYEERGFSYKTGYSSLLNPHPDTLLGYSKPIFHTLDIDKDGGFTVVLEVDLDVQPVDCEIDGIRVFEIPISIYLSNRFKLWFRSKLEMDEIFAKSLKSIESKYADFAKGFSAILSKNDQVFIDPNTLNFSSNPIDWGHRPKKERLLNKAHGIILGWGIGLQKNVSPELRKVQLLQANFQNQVSLYINKFDNKKLIESFKKRVLESLEEISVYAAKNQSLEDELISNSKGLTMSFLSQLKEIRLLDEPVFDIIIDGLVSSRKKNLPIQIRILKLRSLLNRNVSSTGSKWHLETVQNASFELMSALDDVIKENERHISITQKDIPLIEFRSDGFNIELPKNILDGDKELLREVLSFFSFQDDLTSPEQLFNNRTDILKELGVHLKTYYDHRWEGHEAKAFLGLLHKSFKDLRGGFGAKTDSSTLLCLSVLFTSGRELSLYKASLKEKELNDFSIAFALWGAAYGAAAMPKTETESLFSDDEDSIELFKAMEVVTKNMAEQEILAFPEVPLPKIEAVELKKTPEVKTQETIPEENEVTVLWEGDEIENINRPENDIHIEKSSDKEKWTNGRDGDLFSDNIENDTDDLDNPVLPDLSELEENEKKKEIKEVLNRVNELAEFKNKPDWLEFINTMLENAVEINKEEVQKQFERFNSPKGFGQAKIKKVIACIE